MAVTGTPTTAGPTTASPTGATAPEAPARAELEAALERHRRELTGYCYRMLGSPFEAEDAVQDTMVRAWRAADRFEGRSSVRTWLYRIATNVCLDMLQSRKRRPLPMDLGPESPGDAVAAHWFPKHAWRHPRRDGGAARPIDDPAELAASRETIRVAFVAALQHLPPRQRAVLILREVLRWRATEVAELLGTSVVSVNSALQRARAGIAARNVTPTATLHLEDEARQTLLTRYLEAFERSDMESLVSLLHEDATVSTSPRS